MGAHSTLNITREDAIAEAIKSLATATDEELEEALFELVGDKKLTNFRIVPEYTDEWCPHYGDFGL